VSEDRSVESPVASPCVDICALDDKDVCMGCYRTANEITNWRDYSNTEKRQVLRLADERAKNSNAYL
jgi:predicted Fe-S protein YdhL (DUF1289 family)